MKYIIISIIFLILIYNILEYSFQQLTPINHVNNKKSLSNIHLRTGDIILYNSCFQYGFDIYKLFCSTPFTHVALVYVHPNGTLYQIETDGKHGNTCTLLNKQLLQGHVIRQINKPLDQIKMEACVRILLGKKYSYNLWKPFYRKWYPFIPLPVNSKQVLFKNSFCSELISLILIKFGVLNFDDSELQPSLVLPGDFSESGDYILPFVNEYRYGAEILIHSD